MILSPLYPSHQRTFQMDTPEVFSSPPIVLSDQWGSSSILAKKLLACDSFDFNSS